MKTIKSSRAAAWAAGALMAFAATAGAAESPSLKVTTTQDVVNADDNLISLREAISYAASNESLATDGKFVITFDDAIFDGEGKATILLADDKGCLYLSSSSTYPLVIEGPADPAKTLCVDGGLVYNEDYSAIVSGKQKVLFCAYWSAGLTIRNLTLKGAQEAVYTQYYPVEVEGCTFVGNSVNSTYGAAIASFGHLTVKDCVFRNNGGKNSAGGAVIDINAGATFVGNNRFEDSFFWPGANKYWYGAVCAYSGTLVFTNGVTQFVTTNDVLKTSGGDIVIASDARVELSAMMSKDSWVFSGKFSSEGVLAVRPANEVVAGMTYPFVKNPGSFTTVEDYGTIEFLDGETGTLSADANGLWISFGSAGPTFEEKSYTVAEGERFDVVVKGGSAVSATAVTVDFVKGTYTRGIKAYVDGKKASFPLELTWLKGDLEDKVVTLDLRGYRLGSADEMFTLQLSNPASSDLGLIPVTTVNVQDATTPQPSLTPYVRALAWPAQAGKVTGSGVLKKLGAECKLKAQAKAGSTFAGWYRAKEDDAESIDLDNGFITAASSFKANEGGTYYAYFTDVAPAASFVEPDWSSSDVLGVVMGEDGVLRVQLGVYVSFPLDLNAKEGDKKAKLTVAGLPKGLSYSKKTGLVTGYPTAAGSKTLQLKVKNASGAYTWELAMAVVGNTFAGAYAETLRAEGEDVGGIVVAVTEKGKITAVVTYDGKQYKFSDSEMIVGSDGVGNAMLEKSNAGTILLRVNSAGISGSVYGKKFGDGVTFGQPE